MATDIAIMRLQYEILNTPLAQISVEANLPPSLVEKEALTQGWKQLWPDEPILLAPPEDLLPTTLTDLEQASARADALSLEIEQYLDKSRKRLKVYTLAKETLLAHRYLALEVSLLSTAKDMLDNALNGEPHERMTPQALKQLSALYKDLSSESSLSKIAGLSIATDDSGMPTVIIKDLSGSKRS